MGQFCCMYINEDESINVENENECSQDEQQTFTVEEQKQFKE